VADPYRSAGVDYDVLDAAKRRSLEAVASSIAAQAGGDAEVVLETVGEPAQVFAVGGVTLATVLECLGTKSSICFEVEALGIDAWHHVGTDSVAAIVNDLCCVGALPLTVSAYLATGDAAWYSAGRHASLVEGWREACSSAGAMWVGGESPTLQGIVAPNAVDIAGSAVGLVHGMPWLGSRIEPGDDIVLLSSSGLHANGASLARKLAAALTDGWATPVGDGGPSLGEAVLTPAVLYTGVVRALSLLSSDAVHYASHITGHGLRKLMRADRNLTYRVHSLPPVPAVLAFLVEQVGLGAADAYGTFNMGAGFAMFVRRGAGDEVAAAAEAAGYGALVAGSVEEGPREVILEPVDVIYGSDELELR
jgi:phosphoribosylformylglycinamidine cyclo-ligase